MCVLPPGPGGAKNIMLMAYEREKTKIFIDMFSKKDFF